MTTELPLDRVLEKVKEAITKQPQTDKDKENPIKCPHHFGYLSELPKSTPIPEGCFFCSRIVECIAQ